MDIFSGIFGGGWNKKNIKKTQTKTKTKLFKKEIKIIDQADLKRNCARRRVLSQHICNYVSLVMDKMFSETEHDGAQKPHTQEGKHRTNLDANDRKKLRRTA